ncbi:MAG: hypothetical protein HZB62_05725 [Nitrospirae bacterium]|nr:hypothetical protein [Nitrospirota bacterium]
MTMIKKIARNTAIILIPAAIISAFLPWEDLPFSILIGGLLGILNIRALAWSVEGIIGTSSVNMKMLFFSQFRFVMLALIVVLLAYLRLVTIPGIMAGFSVVFSQVLFVGMIQAKKPSDP